MKFLKSPRFGTCSPSAMRSGAISRARARCASTSSGCVGSSIQYGSTADNAWHMCRASRRLHCWLASNISRQSGPAISRSMVALGFSRPYLKLECAEAGGERLLGICAEAPVVILEPAYRSVVAWVAGEQNAFPQRARRQVIAQKRQRFLPVQNVFYVAEVEQCQD